MNHDNLPLKEKLRHYIHIFVSKSYYNFFYCCEFFYTKKINPNESNTWCLIPVINDISSKNTAKYKYMGGPKFAIRGIGRNYVCYKYILDF